MSAPSFTLRLNLTAPPERVWQLLWDLERHTRSVPFTEVAHADGVTALALGTRFVGVTRLGPLVLNDEMVVREWQPSKRAVIEKVGSVLRGTITVTMAPSEGGTAMTWHQTVCVARLPMPLVSLAIPLIRMGYRQALGRILSDKDH